MRKEVLVLAPFWYGIGGAETFAHDLVDELERHYPVKLVTTDFRGTFKGTGLRQFVQIFPVLLKRAFWPSQKCGRIYSMGGIGGFVGAILNARGDKEHFTVLLALYGFKGKCGLFRFLARWVLMRCDRIFVEGQGGWKDIEPLGIPRNKVTIFNHWVNQAEFYPIYRPSHKLRVLFVGRNIPEKGMYIVQEAQRRLSDKEIEFEYITEISHELLAQRYQMADILVVPSQYPEGFVRVVAEGASCGCVVLASDNGSLPELVRHFGWTFAGIDGLKYLIEQFYSSPTWLKHDRKKTIEYARENFSRKNAEVFL
jgi:glycosyltransferase involved in cell wall biosynthesis